mmetsp:Transcript_6911/g.15252  ORF Transcript_6911/g.15252 Transcript_6911/m.15252 type:complete len:105 (-) Transcript_6911:5-319(-)
MGRFSQASVFERLAPLRQSGDNKDAVKSRRVGLAARFRWRHTCAEALAFEKDEPEESKVSVALRAHNTFQVVSRAAMAAGTMRGRLAALGTNIPPTPYPLPPTT